MFPDMEIAKRSKYEKSKLTRLGNQFESKFTETQKDVSAFLTESKKELDGILDFIEKKARTKDFEVEKLIEQKISSHEQWVNTYKKNDEDYTKHQLQRVKELEELYQEKLKLEAPAQYWQKRAKQLKEEGVRWLWGLIIVSVIAILALGAVLYFISDGTLKDLFEKTGSAIRWSIVFVTFVSFLAYAIRVFAKLTFSAYHLFRDAEEREQLAYVYLALKKEQNIDDTERHLIMQSLFSRADSGLLKDDASPTMPGGSLVEKIMGGK
jgi:ABC-type multidrug transport system fused ATPase/permease subunit